MPKKKVATENSLAALHPAVAAQWHPTKNGALTPDGVVAGSHEKAWWKCPEGADHVWLAPINNRTRLRSGCPSCVGKQVSSANSLASRMPEIAEQWHPTKNGDVTANQVTFGSDKKAWWKCVQGADHVWLASIAKRTRSGRGCPSCAGRQVSTTNSLAALHPEIAEQWHPTKNGDVTPDGVVAGSHEKAWWKCPQGADHVWLATIVKRTRSGRGCPSCAGRMVSTTKSLAALYPEIASQWHPTKNGDLTPDGVVAGSNEKAWWKCPQGADHVWLATTASRTLAGSGCPSCAGRQASTTNSLAALYPEIASQWHPTKNGDLMPGGVAAGSARKAWWKCPQGADHVWLATIVSRTRLGTGCPSCAARQASTTNSLAALHPEIASQWHPTKNGGLTPDGVVAGSHEKAWWKCPDDSRHVWRASVGHRTRSGSGCPQCGVGWTKDAVRRFVAELRDHLHLLSPAELYTVLQQSGLLNSDGRSREFIRGLVTGQLLLTEVDRFIVAESFFEDKEDEGREVLRVPDPALPVVPVEDEGTGGLDDWSLPVANAADVLAAAEAACSLTSDETAVQLLVANAVAKIWKHAYHDAFTAVEQATSFSGGDYAERVKTEFLREYSAAVGLAVPPGYSFTIDGRPTPPNLMQRHVAAQVRDRRRVGNWSGTGAGKTLSAILATRVVHAALTVICCPNSIVDGWRTKILEAFPDSVVATKTFQPVWAAAAGRDQARHRYLILNYEALQQPDSPSKVKRLLDHEQVEFVIVDEVHHTKQRMAENLTRRRQVLMALVSNAAERKRDLCVLGMSATPVINNLQEGKSLVELITGLEHPDLETRATVSNCMSLHRSFVQLGTRWMPEYDLEYEQLEIPIDCGEFIDEIRALGSGGSPLALEQILTRARLPIIREHVVPKTLIYTYNIGGIDRMLYDALAADGWRVGFFTGEDKTGLDGFIGGDLDVLIGSAAIATGVDGLQHVCNRVIINVLPWTAAEFDQLKGRLYRQGQSRGKVTMVVPLTHAEINGERWSWCESKMHRLKFKRSVADAAVDGVVPEGHLVSPAQAYQHWMGWLERLAAGDVRTVERPRLVVPLPDDDPRDVDRRFRRYGDFSRLNHRWNSGRSDATHERLQTNPEEWAQYHTLYREARKDWAVVPYGEMIRWCKQRSGYVIGDFGCGEATLAEQVGDRHTVHSFDHIACNDDVVACDIAHVPLEDETLDVVIFSLSLMGSNITDYLREAHRTLKLDGQLHIWEATSRFGDRERFVDGLRKLGFDIVAVTDRSKFTHLRALKADRTPAADARIRL